MAKYDFDQCIDRHGTQCKKIEVLKQDYGRDSEECSFHYWMYLMLLLSKYQIY